MINMKMAFDYMYEKLLRDNIKCKICRYSPVALFAGKGTNCAQNTRDDVDAP